MQKATASREDVLSLTHYRAGCLGIGLGDGETAERARPGVNFMYQAWNSVHTPVVESDPSTT